MTLSRIKGCLLGGAVGDALGAGIEFHTLASIRSQYGESGIVDHVPAYGRVGAITDDTQMTLFTAEGLMRAVQRDREKGVSDPPTVIHHAYLRWLDTQGTAPADRAILDGWLVHVPELRQLRAPGTTCLSALRSGKIGSIAEPLNNSKGCGGVMRVAPIGLAVDDPFDLAAEAAAITHGHPSGYLSAGALAVMLSRLVNGRPLAEAVDDGLASLSGRRGAGETTAALRSAIDLAAEGDPDPEKVESLGGGWVGEEALAISVFCALVATGFEHGVLLAANHSGDSDSTASITGQLLGAHLGAEAIPNHLLEPLELREVIERIGGDLHSGVVLAEPLALDDYPGW